MLLQSADRVDEPGDDPANWQLKAGEPVDPGVLADLAFAWKACRSVKSNAILLAAGGASGVARIIEILRTELEMTMGLAGCTQLSGITSRFLLR